MRHTERASIYVGYAKERRPVRVGDCCVGIVAELAERIEWKPREYEVPPHAATLCRYMDFAKFVAMLKDQGLYFSRVDQLGDPFELAKGLKDRKPAWDEYNLNFYRRLLQNPPAGFESHYTDEQIEEAAHRLLNESYRAGEHQLLETCVSCWHENEGESEALWRLYCGTGPGVVVQTSFGRMLYALRDEPDIAVGRIEYVDFKQYFAGLNEAVFRKRQSLSHEREVRAVHYQFGDVSQPGILVTLDLPILIKQVVVSPFAAKWLRELTRETALRYGYDLNVATSELLLEPFF
jgi:hypothetical protein